MQLLGKYHFKSMLSLELLTCIGLSKGKTLAFFVVHCNHDSVRKLQDNSTKQEKWGHQHICMTFGWNERIHGIMGSMQNVYSEISHVWNTVLGKKKWNNQCLISSDFVRLRSHGIQIRNCLFPQDLAFGKFTFFLFYDRWKGKIEIKHIDKSM